MADKLTKRQRIYARELLFKKQDGKCRYCREPIVVISPSAKMPGENWRRACLSGSDHLVLVCQRCCTDEGPGWREEKAEVERLVSCD